MGPQPTILLIDDDDAVRRTVARLLEREGMAVAAAADGEQGLREFYDRRPDLIALDLGLPGLDGWEVLERIRELSDVPILVLTGADDELNVVRGLRAGADDYVRKPFGRGELVARVEALLRRGSVNGAEDQPVYADEFVRIDHPQRAVQVGGVDVDLTPTEFSMLWALASHPGQLLTHAQLLEMVWPQGSADRDRIKLYVGYVRRKSIEAGGIDPIETVRGFGYRYRPRTA